LQKEILITVSDEKVKVLEEKVDLLLKSLSDIIVERQCIGDWLTEEQAIKLTGLKKSTLYIMRKDGTITSSTITGKSVYYRRSDFEHLLEINEKK
jgi:hypothetical protein